MADNGVPVDLYAPFTSDTLLEIRQGKMKAMEGLKIESGIDKQLCEGAVTIAAGGITGDEHDYTFHGGVDKAIHGCE
jgi:MOSC domain-containing protein YiiM